MFYVAKNDIVFREQQYFQNISFRILFSESFQIKKEKNVIQKSSAIYVNKNRVHN